MEAKTTNASFEREKLVETKKLKIAWPPPAESTASGTLEENLKVFKPKWPPSGEMLKPESEEDSDLKKLRRSSSLKERSRPFTLSVAKPVVTKRPQSPVLKKRNSLNLRDDFEDETEDKIPTAISTKPQQDELETSEDKLSNETEDKRASLTRSNEQSFLENGDISEAEVFKQQLSPKESTHSKHSSTEDLVMTKDRSPTHIRKSQDIGYWEGEDVEELSVEEQIKRNRYYDDDEEEED